MIQIPRSFMMLPVAAICVALAGCGSPSANKPIASSTTPSTTPGTPVTVPTQAVLPTPVIVGSPAAIVNGHAIPISTYRLFLNLAQKSSGNTPGITTKQLAKQVMDEVIFNEIVRQYAVSHKISATQKDVAAQIKTAETQTGGAQKFEKQLAQYGLTLSTYEQLVQPNLLAQKVEAVVSPIPPARSDASAKARAENVLSQLKHGANFATLAHKYSDDTGSAVKGGDLGSVFPNQTVPPFNQAAFHAPLNTFVLVHSQYGYHIIEVLSRGTGTPPGQPNAKPTETAHVRHILISTQPTGQQQQRTQFLAWLHTRENQAKIKRIATVK